jgi:hypothetical protein
MWCWQAVETSRWIATGIWLVPMAMPGMRRFAEREIAPHEKDTKRMSVSRVASDGDSDGDGDGDGDDDGEGEKGKE